MISAVTDNSQSDLIRILIGLSFFAILSGCGGPTKVDTSSKESFEMTFAAAKRELPPEAQERLIKAVFWLGSPEPWCTESQWDFVRCLNESPAKINGAFAKEIIARAEALARTGEVQKVPAIEEWIAAQATQEKVDRAEYFQRKYNTTIEAAKEAAKAKMAQFGKISIKVQSLDNKPDLPSTGCFVRFQIINNSTATIDSVVLETGPPDYIPDAGSIRENRHTLVDSFKDPLRPGQIQEDVITEFALGNGFVCLAPTLLRATDSQGVVLDDSARNALADIAKDEADLANSEKDTAEIMQKIAQWLRQLG